MLCFYSGNTLAASEQLDRQHVQTPEPTRHQYKQPCLRNEKKNEFREPIHNITKVAKQNAMNPVFRTNLLRQDAKIEF